MPIIRRSYLLVEEAKKPSSKQHDNFERFFRIGWPTLLQNIEWNDVATFFIIVRGSEKTTLERYIQKYVTSHLQSIFTIISQEDLITVRDMEKSRVQMLSKIIAATIVPTSHYLILDDDIVALRKFGFRDIFTDASRRFVRYTHDDTFHENWVSGSAEALKLDYKNEVSHMFEKLQQRRHILSVTPEIFITKQAISLLDKLKELHGPDNYQQTLSSMKGRWTEYMLMWIHLMQKGSVTKWYRKAQIPLSDNTRNIWYASTNLKDSLKKMWSDPKPYFGVIQSNVPENEVETVIAALRTI